MAKTDWPVKTLGELFEFKNGRGFKKTEWSTSGLPIIRIQNLNSDSASYNYFSGTFDKGILVEPGDLLFSWSGSIGTSFGPHIWRRSSGLLNQHIFKVSPKVPIDTDYAHYCLRVITAEIERSVNGAVGLVHITKEKLNKFEIPVPPLDEQKRIVALLDAATARVTELTACYEQARTHANNLFASALRGALEGNPDWPVKTLGEVCSIESVLVDPKDLKYSGMVHIGAGNIEAKTGRLFGIKTAREEKLISGKFLYSDNDVLYSKIRPYLEKVALPAESGLCSADVYPLQPGPLLTRMFLFYTLISETFTEYAISGSSRTGMPKVNREHLFKYEIKVPPLAVQTEIVERLDATRTKKSEMVAAYDAKLTAAKNLRQSILEAAFAGDL